MVIIKTVGNVVKYICEDKAELENHYKDLLRTDPPEFAIAQQYTGQYEYIIPAEINDALREASKCIKRAVSALTGDAHHDYMQAEQLIQRLYVCSLQPGATISITIEPHNGAAPYTAKLYDHAVLVDSLIHTLENFKEEL